MRARQGRVEQLRDEGRRGAALVAQADRAHRRVPVGLPARHHDGLAGHRLPGRAGDRERCSRTRSATSISHNASLAISLALAYLITTALHITFGEQVPKIYSIVHAETHGAAGGAPARVVPARLQPADLAAQLGLERRSCGCVGVDPRAEFEDVSSSEDLKLIIARSAARREARPRRGRDAVGRLPPARAAGAPGDDADPRGGDRGRVRDAPRRRCAARSTPATRGWS